MTDTKEPSVFETRVFDMLKLAAEKGYFDPKNSPAFCMECISLERKGSVSRSELNYLTDLCPFAYKSLEAGSPLGIWDIYFEKEPLTIEKVITAMEVYLHQGSQRQFKPL